MTTKVAIICGLDGSGKSTLREELERHGHEVLYYKDLNGTVWGEGLNFVNPGTEVAQLQGEARTSYILRYLNAETARIEDRLQRSDSVVADGYFLRFFAKEKVFGRSDYGQFVAGARLADAQYLFMLLDLDPALCYDRKVAGNHRITPYECTTPTKEGFLEFQERQRAFLMEYIANQKTATIIDATSSPSEVAREALTFLRKHGIDGTGVHR